MSSQGSASNQPRPTASSNGPTPLDDFLVVAVVGSTGVGKSQLAVDLAKALPGLLPSNSPSPSATSAPTPNTSKPFEIISADSMQVYSTLPIATNHPPPEDLAAVKHHLLGFLPSESEFTVVDFVSQSLQIIEGIRNRGGRGVVVVGGTGYYISSLLWEGMLTPGDKVLPGEANEGDAGIGEPSNPSTDTYSASEAADAEHDPATADLRRRIRAALLDANSPAASLHSLLSQADPPLAQIRHPNDVRRVRRALEVFLSSGPQSQLWQQQKAQRQEGTMLRYRTALFWCHSDPKYLDPRLDTRVDKMLERGMLDELRVVKEIAVAGRLPCSVQKPDGTYETDWTRGIAQAIGFKEFAPYLGLTPTDMSPEEALKAGVEDTKLRTRRYAKTQQKWLRNKLVPILLKEAERHIEGGEKKGGGAWAVDVDAEPWQKVVDRACHTALDFFVSTPGKQQLDPVLASLLSTSDSSDQGPSENVQPMLPCPVCTDHLGKSKMVMGGHEWAVHLKSKGHKAAERRKKEMEGNPVYKAKAEEAQRRRAEEAS